MANKIVTLLLNEKGEYLKKISEYELKEIMDKNGVPFFPGVYDTPHDIWELVEKEELTPAEVRKFQQLTRRQNINKQNMIVVNKDKLAKAADLMEIGEICGFVNNDGNITVKEVQRFMAKIKRLQLIVESYNDKLNRVEYYVNPCYHKPGSRLNVELYGLFRDYLWGAMTVKESPYASIKGKKDIKEGEISTNTYRNMIEQAYQLQRTSTAKDDSALKIVEEVRVKVAIDKLNDAKKEAEDFGIGVDDIFVDVEPINEDDAEMLNECVETIREVFGKEVIIKDGLQQKDFWTVKNAMDEFVATQDEYAATAMAQGLLIING